MINYKLLWHLFMILRFSADYFFLSNMSLMPKPLVYQNIEFKTSENFYQAMKVTDLAKRKEIANMPAKKSKVFVRKLYKKNNKNHRADFDYIKLEVMEYILRHKFNHEPYRTKLIDTAPKELIEGNYWNDVFWGVDLKDNEMPGANHLGRILMKLRNELIENTNIDLFSEFKKKTKKLKKGKIIVVNRRLEKEDVYIGRGSLFGNPYNQHDNEFTNSTDDSIRLYEHHLKNVLLKKDTKPHQQFKEIQHWIKNGHDIKLGCFCKKCTSDNERYHKIEHKCHGDTIKYYLENYKV